MAIIQCPECGREVSTRAAACPHCGCPLGEVPETLEAPESRDIPASEEAGKSAAAESSGEGSTPAEKPAAFYTAALDKAKELLHTAQAKAGDIFGKLTGKAKGLAARFTALPDEKKKKIKLYSLVGTAGACVLVAFLSLLLSTCLIVHHYSRATCTEPRICKKCGVTSGEPLGHNYIGETLKEETCSEMGETQYTCERCGKQYLEDIPVHPHTPTEATCTEASVCEECGQEMSPALGHKIETYTSETPATCTAEGSRGGVCTVCGEEVVETIPKLEHTPGGWEVVKAATFDEDGERVKKCTVCGTELERESYELSDAEKVTYLKNNCKTYTYDEIFRYPEKYKGQYAKFKGEVVQVMDSWFGTVLRVDVTRGSYVWTDTIYVNYYGDDVNGAKILEDDIVWLYGKLNGTETYETVIGGTVTIPRMECWHIEFA